MKIGQDVYLYEGLLYKWLIYLSIWCSQWAPIARRTYKTCFCFRFLLLWSAHWLIFRWWSGLDPFDPSLFLLGGNASATMLIYTYYEKEVFGMLGRVWTLNGVTLILRFSVLFFSLGSFRRVKLSMMPDYEGMRVWKDLHLSKVSQVDPMELNCI